MSKAVTSRAVQSQRTRQGCRTQPLNRSSSPWSGSTLRRQQTRSLSRPLQLGRSCAQRFGIEKTFCLWTSCLKAPKSTQVSIATHLKKLRRAIHNKRRGMLGRSVVMIHENAPPHTLPPQRKISSRHLAGNNTIIPPSVQT